MIHSTHDFEFTIRFTFIYLFFLQKDDCNKISYLSGNSHDNLVSFSKNASMVVKQWDTSLIVLWARFTNSLHQCKPSFGLKTS